MGPWPFIAWTLGFPLVMTIGRYLQHKDQIALGHKAPSEWVYSADGIIHVFIWFVIAWKLWNRM